MGHSKVISWGFWLSILLFATKSDRRIVKSQRVANTGKQMCDAFVNVDAEADHKSEFLMQ